MPVGRWKGAALLSPLADVGYTADTTRLVVDLFVHNAPGESQCVSSKASGVPGVRPAGDNSGSCFGPHMFREASPNGRVEPRFWFTLRMGYLDSP